MTHLPTEGVEPALDQSDEGEEEGREDLETVGRACRSAGSMESHGRGRSGVIWGDMGWYGEM